MSDLAARLNCSGKGRFDVLYQPIGSYYWLLGRPQWCTHAYQAPASQCGGSGIAELTNRLTELQPIR
jgi:hypothetical protein